MSENKFSSCVGWVVAYLGLTVISVIVDGWALSKIWNWFIPPIFNLPFLTLMQSVGVAMVLQLFTRTNKTAKDKDETDFTGWQRFLYVGISNTITPVLSVGIAWIVLQFAF